MRPALTEHPERATLWGGSPALPSLALSLCPNGLGEAEPGWSPRSQTMPARPAVSLPWPHSPEQLPAPAPRSLRGGARAPLPPSEAARTRPEPPRRAGLCSSGGAARKSAPKSENERSSGSSGQPVECRSSPTQASVRSLSPQEIQALVAAPDFDIHELAHPGKPQVCQSEGNWNEEGNQTLLRFHLSRAADFKDCTDSAQQVARGKTDSSSI